MNKQAVARIAPRIATLLWLGVVLVEFVVWAMIGLIGGDFMAPWWTYTLAVGGVVVAALWSLPMAVRWVRS